MIGGRWVSLIVAKHVGVFIVRGAFWVFNWAERKAGRGSRAVFAARNERTVSLVGLFVFTERDK